MVKRTFTLGMALLGWLVVPLLSVQGQEVNDHQVNIGDTPTEESAGTTAPVTLDDPRVTLPADLTAFEAVRHIFDRIPYQLNYRELCSAEEIEALQEQTAVFYTDVPSLWPAVLREVIAPLGLDYLEDNGIVRIGSVHRIEQRQMMLAQERLRRNRTPIEVNFDQTPLYSALITIRSLAGINVNFDFMEPADRRIAPDRDEEGPDAQVGHITTYQTPEGQLIEWRIVLREVLNPFGYDFIEHNGVVRPMKTERVARWHQEQIDARPLVTRLVRVYHAAPDDIVERVRKVSGLLKHAQAFIESARGTTTLSHSRRFTGTTLTAPRAEGQTLGGDVGGFSRYGDMDRFRIPPSVLIADVEENLERIEQQIRMLDLREQQVLIEAKIFEVSADSTRTLGVDWERLGGGGTFESELRRSGSRQRERGGTVERWQGDGRYVTEERLLDPAGETLAYGRFLQRTAERMSASRYSAILNPLEFEFFWSAIQRAQDFQVLSQPTLVIGDHSEAVIRVGGLEPIIRQERNFVRTGDAGGFIEITYDADYVQTGISLWVVPEISEDGRTVRLSIHPQTLNTIGEVRVGAEQLTFPVFAIREIDTRVAVPSGHTLMLGGLIEGQSGTEQRKIPLLGDIPVLGRLFRWERDSRDGRNLVILMTPTILDDEMPDTGYEAPARPFLDDLQRGLGRDLESRRPDVDEISRERQAIKREQREASWSDEPQEEWDVEEIGDRPDSDGE